MIPYKSKNQLPVLSQHEWHAVLLQTKAQGGNQQHGTPFQTPQNHPGQHLLGLVTPAFPKYSASCCCYQLGLCDINVELCD
jgi:hypothetical protein